MRLVYISHGDVPSKWAHSFQAMKMADAFASQVASLRLLTAGSLLPSAIHQVHLPSWYGVGPGVRVVRLPTCWRTRDPFFHKVESRRFDRLAAAFARIASPHLVYSRSLGAGVRCVRLGLPTVLELHHNPAEWEPHRAAIADLALLASRPALRGVVTVTEHLAGQYADLGFPRDRLLVWPDAVDLEAFAHAPAKPEARPLFGLPQERPVVVYTGHFYPEKGVPCLVDAAKLAPELTFCLAGGMTRDVNAMKRRAAHCRNVQFEGFVPQGRIPELLAAADCVVLPNSAKSDHARATSPLKLFEYMASGRPIVATAIPALEPLLRDGENALLVEPDSPEALAAGIRRVTQDPALAARLAEQARSDVRPYTWKRRASEILERFTGPELHA